MIFDSHVHIAAKTDLGGFRTPPLTGEHLLKLMDGPLIVDGRPRRVDRALLQPLISVPEAGDPIAHHRYVAEQVAAHPDRFVGCFVASPLLDTDLTLGCLRQLVRNAGFRCVKFHPTVHGYMPFRSRDRLEPILREAAQLGIPVMFHQGDPPFGHPSQLVGMMEAHRDLTFILAHFATQRMVMADEAIYVARMNSNVVLETSWVDLPRLKEGVAELGSSRIVFGSDCPIQEMWSQLRTIEVLGWEPPIGIGLPAEDRERLYGDNMAKLVR
jgi:predicted TIM-barrel fold metal-dependent hydrolase